MLPEKGKVKYKAAAVQAAPIVRNAPHWFDLKASLDKALMLIEEAGANGAGLVVFPECWLPCFPYWSLDFADRPTFREIWAAFLSHSVEVPGWVTEKLCEAARKVKAYLVVGINERDRQYHGRMYNSILYIHPHGEIMGVHRKICNTNAERLFHVPGDGGDNLKAVFSTELGKIGGSICGEHHQLALLYQWVLQGVQVHCSLWPGNAMLARITDLSTRAFCLNAGAFGVLAATYIPKESCPNDFYSNSAFRIPGFFKGGSGIINPFGEYLAGPVYDQETIVYGDIDLSDIDRSRTATNLVGLYSRWDLLTLNVRQHPYEPAVPLEDGASSHSEAASHRLDLLEQRLKNLEARTDLLSENAK